MDNDNPRARARALWLSQHLDATDAPPDAPLPLAARNPSTFWSSVRKGVGLLIFLVFVAISFLYNPGRQTYTNVSPQADCYRIPTPASSTKSFPLPHPVNKSAHQVVLHNIGWSEPQKLLSDLIDGRSLVCSRLSDSVTSIQEFLKFLAYTCSKSSYTEFALTDAFNIIDRRLHETITKINHLVALYGSMESSYYELNSSAAEALQKGQLSHMHRSLIKNQPSDLKYFGIDFYKWWGLPFKIKVRKSEEARSGVIALNRESQRLEQIGLVFRELKHIADEFAASITRWDTEFDDDGSRQERLQVWLQVWLREKVYQNPRLRELWTELLASVNEKEERLLIKFTTEWCG